MFEAHLKKADILKRVVDAVKVFVKVANIRCSPDGLSMNVLCDNNTVIVLFHLDSGLFDTLRCDRPVELGINFSSLAKVLARVDDEKEVHLSSMDDGSSSDLVIKYRTSDRNTSCMRLSLCEVATESLDIPENRDIHALIDMPSSDYKRIIGDLSNIGKIITIDARDGRVEFITKSEDIGNGCYVRRNGEGCCGRDRVTVTIEKAINARLKGTPLSKLIKACALGDTTTIAMAPREPLEVTFALPDGESSVSFYLACNVVDSE